MNEYVRNPEFWAALAVGLVSVGLLLYWLITGARSGRRGR